LSSKYAGELKAWMNCMKPRDIFGIILRSVALYLVIWGSWNSIAGMRYFVATLAALLSGSANKCNFGFFIYGIPALLGGILILWFADAVVNWTYPSKKPPELPPE